MAQLGFQCALSVNDGVADAQQAVTDKLAQFTLPDREATVHAHVNHGQADAIERIILGIIKQTPMKVELFYDATTWQRFNTMFLARALKTWECSEPDQAGSYTPLKIAFSGGVSKMPGHAFERDGITMFSVEVHPSGPWTVTGGS